VKRTSDVQVVPDAVLHEVGYSGFQKYFELEEAGVVKRCQLEELHSS
jgi:hypothetical protein